MERRIRYEVLQTEDDDDVATSAVRSPPTVDLNIVAPPASAAAQFEEVNENGQQADYQWNNPDGKTESVDPTVPPSYSVATTLPSYEEAEKTKQEELEQLERQQQEEASNRTQNVHDIDRFTDMQLGTDGMFLCMFIIAFLFNWVGLLASLCITHTIAGRFGAISGFGLSMVKWVAIVKHNNWAAGLADGDSWLWWLLIVLGFLIFFRGCTQYIRLKYQWNRIGNHLRNRVYLLF